MGMTVSDANQNYYRKQYYLFNILVLSVNEQIAFFAKCSLKNQKRMININNYENKKSNIFS